LLSYCCLVIVALFKQVDWSKNQDELPTFNWKKVDRITKKYFPTHPLSSVSFGSSSTSYLSPQSVVAKLLFAHGPLLGGEFEVPSSSSFVDSSSFFAFPAWQYSADPNVIVDVWDGSYWKQLDADNFFSDKRNIVFGLFADGFAKFRTKGQSTGT